MLIFFLIKTLFLWCFAVVFLFAFISSICKRAKGKLKHLRFSDRLTFKEFIELLFVLVIAVYTTYLSIPYSIDTYLYFTNSYPIENAKVLKVMYYSSGIGRGRILIENGYETSFLINGKEVTMKVERKLAENTIYQIRCLPHVKYVIKAW